MVKINSKILLVIVIGLAVIASGCTGGQDVTSVVKALPEVQQFMKEHPNAQITVTYWSKEEVAQSSQEISQQCDKPITPVAMYKATVSEGDLKIVSWINAENQIVMCSTTTGSGGVSPKLTPKSDQTNKLEIINLDVQQVVLNDSEIKEVIGFNWGRTTQDKQDFPGKFQRMVLEYQNINSNTKEKKDISILMLVFPNITATKEGYSKMLLDMGKDVSETDINIGDTGKVITCKSKGCGGILFIKNNVIVMISSSSMVDMETMNKLAKRQEDKILGILEGKGGPRLTFTPFPTVTQSKSTMPTKEAETVIGENILVEAVDGVVNSANALVGLNITIRVAPRSPDTDLSRLILRVKAQHYIYSGYSAGTGNAASTFRVYTLKDTDNGMGAPINSYTGISSPILKAGALVRLDVDVSSLNIKAKDSITLSLTPEKGTPLNLPLTLPAFGNEGIISIYP